VQRRNRLSRSRDFDAVYRHGRSVSTRYLTLHWFAREDDGDDPRLGLAVPKAAGPATARNRVKRQLRELWRSRLETGAIAASNDYVLSVRPGLPEAAEARGHEWLAERLDELLSQAGPEAGAPRRGDADAAQGSTP
jgi:ribonuclease P protein component